ncbi:acetoacetate--CoA ligase [Marinobacter nanhaiticus D15-8W]|uniref:Acetoacetate--CoA ligase n=1 Tax=Marinobacter nanhaiticus D15-8W TaxID=626887 RepID=N6VUR5_9GAMM|nr:acetoacetate--CoA ligase [Marinobacter nanhaiticus]ENO13910.1 acetoacetate--CoA ligase [Marinobacter nanhaiticus D15-8W]BES71287.1 acetoacetate--CoA ligase [Marinobacter nanhaiticus D15-8W]
MTKTPLWQPTPDRIAQTRMTQFEGRLRQQYPDMAPGYEGLHTWSVANAATFWRELADEYGVLADWSGPDIETGADVVGQRFFPETRINFAENLLARGNPDAVAIIEHREDGRRRIVTFADLRHKSQALAGYLKTQGVEAGDRVAGFVPNGIEAVVGMLAASQLGAVWSSCSPDFGLNGVIDRFGQIEPKVLIAISGYTYNGKVIDTRQRVADIVEKLPALKRLIRIDNHSECPWSPEVSGIDWDDALQTTPETHYTRLPFNSPLYILYSSGTTGVPKCIVHGIGGTLMQHIKELALHTDLRAGDRMFYYTTCGWMMWNWLVSSLGLGATLVLFDGSPFSPEPSVLWDIAEKEQVRIFGASAKYYAACEKAGLKPAQSHNLEHLDALLSTGSPLSHESFDYLYRDVKPDVCVSSISGGTDIVACFALGNPNLPVYRGELQCVSLAMDVAFVDDDGNPLDEGKGELICRNAFPSMPVGFWNDPDNERFRDAYFSRFPCVWAHGDYGELSIHPKTETTPEQRGVLIHGRSDATLNPGGVRIGTAEIYRQVEKVDAVLESLAIGQQWEDDVRVVLFVRLREGVTLDDELAQTIRQTVRSNTTPRHVPARIIQVPDIPRTISGKIVELAVRNVVHGEPVKNQDALANPEALKHFENIPELQQ